MSLATYTFTSHVQRGFTPNASGEATVTVRVNGQPDITRTVSMMGPADVIGIAPGQVIRSWPRDGVHNAEPNYLALVELDAPDLPWLFGRPVGDGRFHPWLMLVVIDVSTIEDPLVVAPEGTKVTIPADQRPDPAEAWLWAHGQLLGTDTVPDDPARSLSRLVCPRRLEPEARYLACVVPTFEGGRRAGLGIQVADDDPVRTSSTPGWEPAGGAVELPVYHWFRFSTGPAGDFESLVRRLHGVPLPDGLGRRRLRLDHPLSNLPYSGTGDLELHVALRPLGAETGTIAGIGVTDYLAALSARLTDADYDVSLLGDLPPRVGPPVYGQLPAGADARVANLGTGRVPPWLEELNLDPRHRVAAGLGAEVVRRNQEHYMEEAWRQVGDVLAANRLRRRAEFSLGATQRLYQRWIDKLGTGDLLTATAPVHAKVLASPGETIVGRLRDSPLPPPVVSVELRRFARARGALAHAADWQQAVGVRAVAERSADLEPLVQRIPLDAVDRLEPPSRVWDAVTAKDILSRLVDSADVAALEPDVAAARLDKVSTLQAFTLPTAEVVAQHVGATPIDLDRTMSSIGLLPTAAVVDAITPQPPEPPPEPAPEPPGGGHGPFAGPLRPGHGRRVAAGLGGLVGRGGVERGVHEERLAEALGGLLGRTPAGAHGIDDLVVHRVGRDDLDLAPVLRPTEVLAAVKEHPVLVSHVGDEVVLDTVRLSESSRTGRAATTIDAAAFDQLVAGTFTPPAPPAVGFDVPASRATDVRTELGEAFVNLAGLVIRPGDAVPRPGRPLAGGLDSLREPLLEALDPSSTIRRAVNSRISGLGDAEAEVLADIMAAPDLSEPSYNQLSAISHDWLLPGLDGLPTDTTTLVAANREFIAAFLVGMNHELARELLWREYPTDQRGTYARQFWTHLTTRTPSERFDLRQELHRATTSVLPELTLAAPGGGERPEDPLVLVVKGELVQRYPGLIIVAATTRQDGVNRVPQDPPMLPDFAGLLEPDVLLVGFTGLTEKQVRAAEASNDPDERWWFFFAEHFAEPRFGLDEPDAADPGPPASWNDASWDHVPPDDHGFLTTGSSALSLRKGIDLTRPETFSWGSTAADQAWITLQFPFRRGIPAGKLLPPEEAR